MSTLCTIADVEAVLGTTITDATKANKLIELVSNSIEGEVGRSLDTTAIVGEVQTRRYLTHTRLVLNRWPIASVEAVTDDGVLLDAADYSVDLEAGVLWRLSSPNTFGVWVASAPGVIVDYTPAVPAELVTLCAQIVARSYNVGTAAAAAAPAAMAGLKQLAIGRWSATKETGAAGNNLGTALNLNELEVRTAHRYRERRP